MNKHVPPAEAGGGSLAKSPSALAMMVGAVGVVYGDIGTSPLYTLRACLTALPNYTPEDVLGILSILFWMLMVVVSFKYMTLVLQADNRGEGGTLALLELAIRGRGARLRWFLIVTGILGAALFYGDSMITPAISVLSALEGVSVVSNRLQNAVVPVALLILIGLFAMQSKGTGAMGRLFGPIMTLWFVTLGALGLWQISQYPAILAALDPLVGIHFVIKFPLISFILLGAVVLALTGAEALYADMGHFGRPAIRRAWFWLVAPALTLCYFGQGALILRDPTAIKNPFFLMAPAWGLVALVALATVATIIASQAVISGAFSVTRQAVQLGFWPKMEILHTSASEEGQIYVPQVKTFLLVAVILLVLVFRSSDNLAAAYGFAVTGTMLSTSLLAFAVLPGGSKGLRRALWLLVLSILLTLDVFLFSANAVKVMEGGWMPLLVGLLVFTLMTTWRRGRQFLFEVQSRDRQPLAEFMQQLEEFPPARVDGTAIFMSMTPGIVPSALLHNLKHNKVLHQCVLFLTISGEGVPYIASDERFDLAELSKTSWRATVRYGFKEEPDVPAAIRAIAHAHPEIDLDPMRTSYFLSRQTMVAARHSGWWHWRRTLFGFMARNSTRSTKYFKIPPNRVVEMGMQVEI